MNMNNYVNIIVHTRECVASYVSEKNTGYARMRCRRYCASEPLAGVNGSEVKRDSVIAHRMPLSFWKSLKWAWKECRERIEDKETLLTGYV